MKTPRTIPVFKKSGSPLEMNNYRPMAIINAFSKIFEKIISKRLVTFLAQNNFFFQEQFGFLQGRSTNHAVMKILMVYFWTYAHPLYCPSDLQARGFNSCGRSDGHVKNSILVHPTYFKLSLRHVSRSWWAFFVGLMGIFRRSDGHFS